MDKKRPLGNSELTAMFGAGAAASLLGLIIWAINTDFDASALSGASETNAAGQFLGTAIGMLGILLVSLGWAAAAICRQIVDTSRADS